MKINIAVLIAAASLACLSLSTQANEASIKMYGRVDIAYDQLDMERDGWYSHVSRIGVKGAYAVAEEAFIIYQFEQEVDLAHGGEDVDDLLSTRNSFIGVDTKYGKFMWGTHDSPFKQAQGKVDLFNDQIGDIKSLFVGEVRAADSFFYHSPEWSGWELQAMIIPSDNNFKNSKSLSLNYKKGDWDLSLGVDLDTRKNNQAVTSTKVYNSYRSALQYTPGAWRFGVILQQSERQNTTKADPKTGYTVSVAYDFGKFSTIVQYGDSEIVGDKVTSKDLGIEYHLNEKTKLYLYQHNYENNGNFAATSFGLQWNF